MNPAREEELEKVYPEKENGLTAEERKEHKIKDLMIEWGITAQMTELGRAKNSIPSL